VPFLDSHGDERGTRLRPAAVRARRPIGTRGSPTPRRGTGSHSLVSAATGFIAAKDAVALRAWGIGPPGTVEPRGRDAWLALGYQREFCTATTGFVRKLSENTLRHNGIHIGIASAAPDANGRV
jgi:hypothetical protein